MREWITQRKAAEVLGVHPSLIPKMLRRGDLTARQGQRPSLRLTDVEALREKRAAPRPPKPPKPPRSPAPRPQPPDGPHEWLTSDEAAALMGVTRNAVNERAARGRLPSVLHDRRRWFRRDHLELVKRADEVKQGAASLAPPTVR